LANRSTAERGQLLHRRQVDAQGTVFELIVTGFAGAECTFKQARQSRCNALTMTYQQKNSSQSGGSGQEDTGQGTEKEQAIDDMMEQIDNGHHDPAPFFHRMKRSAVFAASFSAMDGRTVRI
jgi:hypothetical protein